MKKILSIALLFAGFLFLTMQSCTNDELPQPTAPSCDMDTITYDADIKAIIDNSCAYAGCHVSGFSSGDFTSYDGIQPFTASGAFTDRVITQREDTNSGMPPNYAPVDRPQDLTAEELLLVECWIDGGFLEN